MLKTLTVTDFEALLNQTFYLTGEGVEPLPFQLTEVTAIGADAAQQKADLGRRFFSVIFHGPVEPLLPQRIYQLENDRMGQLALFLVPLGPDSRGMRYQAVFT
ncbi:MAG: hypothetical protein GY794_24510 [bacterium]|nr:hypothetical protein [bacterium]